MRRRGTAWTRRSSSVPPTSTRTGRVRIGVGATLVRHSDPEAEAAETRAKAAGLIAALESGGRDPLRRAPVGAGRPGEPQRRHRRLLARESAARPSPASGLVGRKVLVVDAEDTFTAMIAHQIRSLGMVVTVRRFDEDHTFDGYDLVVMGPGPGDPAEADHPKIHHLRQAVGRPAARAPAVPRGLPQPSGAQPAARLRPAPQGRAQPGGAAGDRPVRQPRTRRLLQHVRRAEHGGQGRARGGRHRGGLPRPGHRRGSRPARSALRLDAVPRRVRTHPERPADRR